VHHSSVPFSKRIISPCHLPIRHPPSTPTVHSFNFNTERTIIGAGGSPFEVPHAVSRPGAVHLPQSLQRLEAVTTFPRVTPRIRREGQLVGVDPTRDKQSVDAGRRRAGNVVLERISDGQDLGKHGSEGSEGV
jgi:hypothetical protein